MTKFILNLKMFDGVFSQVAVSWDYVAAVSAAGGNWKMGGTGTGQEDSLVTAMLEKEFGIKHTYVPFKGGGTVAETRRGDLARRGGRAAG